MKDPRDTKTADLLGEKRPRGRPAKYASHAERQKAYRERQKARGLREVRAWVPDERHRDASQ